MNEQEFTDFLRLKRREKRMTLRRMCELTGINPVDYSRMERGMTPPVKDVGVIADVLELSDEDSRKLCFLAEVARVNWSPAERKPLFPAFIEFEDGHVPTKEELKSLFEWFDSNDF